MFYLVILWTIQHELKSKHEKWKSEQFNLKMDKSILIEFKLLNILFLIFGLVSFV